jgi:hypothetical protein
VLAADPMIRFAAIATPDADIVAVRYNHGVQPLLTEEESNLSMMQSLMRAAIRRTLENKLGRTLYATAVYEKVKRATISISDKGVDNAKASALLMISVEKEADLESLITNKILPMVENY